MNSTYKLLILWMVFLLSACTSSAPNYGGNWQPINTFSSGIQEIPLTRPYRFYVLPIDKTLKSLLARWSSDNMSVLDYQYHLDFTLPQQTATISTTNPVEAIELLNAVYKNKNIVIRRESNGHITVVSQKTSAKKS